MSKTGAEGTPVNKSYLLTPLTHQDSTATHIQNELTATPPQEWHAGTRRLTPTSAEPQAFSSPPGDTQALSQFLYPPRAFADEVEDEAAEGVWGYLIPLDDKIGNPLVLRKRDNYHLSPGRASERNGIPKSKTGKGGKRQQTNPENQNLQNPPRGGCLIGRHPECGR